MMFFPILESHKIPWLQTTNQIKTRCTGAYHIKQTPAAPTDPVRPFLFDPVRWSHSRPPGVGCDKPGAPRLGILSKITKKKCQKIEGPVWYTVYHHLPVVKGVFSNPSINQPTNGKRTSMTMSTTPVGPKQTNKNRFQRDNITSRIRRLLATTSSTCETQHFKQAMLKACFLMACCRVASSKDTAF